MDTNDYAEVAAYHIWTSRANSLQNWRLQTPKNQIRNLFRQNAGVIPTVKKDYSSPVPVRLENDQKRKLEALSKSSAVKLNGSDLVRIAVRFFLVHVEENGLGSVITELEKREKGNRLQTGSPSEPAPEPRVKRPRGAD